MSTPSDSRVMDLVRRHIEDIITADERRELEEYLERSEDARRTYVEEMKLHAALRVAILHAEEPALPSATGHGATYRRIKPPARWAAWAGWGAVAACLAVVAGTYYLLGMSKPDSKPVEAHVLVAGEGVVTVRNGNEIPVKEQPCLQAGDVLKVPSDTTAIVTYFYEKTRLALGGGTELEFGWYIAGKRLTLNRGTLEATVVRQPAGQPMVLTTPHGEVTVTGTALRLSVTAEETLVEVTEGKVLLESLSTSESVIVCVGERAVAAPGRQIVVCKTPAEKAALGHAEPSGEYAEAGEGIEVIAKRMVQEKAPEEGLVGWWKFDEGSSTTAVDSSGNGNHGTLVNGPTWTSKGRIGGALKFDGKDDYVDCGNHASLNIADAITIAAWVKPREEATFYYIVSNKTRGDTTGGYQMEIQSDRVLVFCFSDGTNICSVRGTTLFAQDKWFHVAATYDRHNVILYVNGNRIRSTPHTEAIGPPPLNTYIGKKSWREGFFRGTIDEVRIYDRALTQQEIRRHSHETARKVGAF